jgi:tetratricopeptide (TPR) repeat protein
MKNIFARSIASKISNMSFTTHIKAVSFVAFSILIHGLSSSPPVYAYFKGSSIEDPFNQVNKSSKSPSDRKQRERYLSSTIETKIEQDFNAGRRNMDLGQYLKAINKYSRAIEGLRTLVNSLSAGEGLKRVWANLAICHENRSLAFLKHYSAFPSMTELNDRALEDLGEAARYYHLADDRAKVLETLQEIRRIWGSKADRYERWYSK